MKRNQSNSVITFLKKCSRALPSSSSAGNLFPFPPPNISQHHACPRVAPCFGFRRYLSTSYLGK